MLRKICVSTGLVISLIFSPFVLAKDVSNLNQIMSKIAQQMTVIYPLITAKHKLSKQDSQILKEKTGLLLELFTQAKPYINQRSDTYQVSYDLVLQHLKKTKQSFERSSNQYARKRLHSLGTICISCHTQDTQLRSTFGGAGRNAFDSDFAFAEFSFMTRNYNDATKYYDKFLRSTELKSELDIIKPLQRLVTIHTQIFDSPGVAAKQLSEYRNLAAHTKKTSEHLDGWIQGLKSLRKQHVKSTGNMTFSKLESYVKRYIGDTDQAGAEFFASPQDEVSRVWLRGVLFHYLNTNPPKDEIPKILYWLSICDRTLGYSFNFSFADLYLKECIIGHATHPYAKRCYREFEEFVSVSYSGSGGTFIPPELEDELFELKQHLKESN